MGPDLLADIISLQFDIALGHRERLQSFVALMTAIRRTLHSFSFYMFRSARSCSSSQAFRLQHIAVLVLWPRLARTVCCTRRDRIDSSTSDNLRGSSGLIRSKLLWSLGRSRHSRFGRFRGAFGWFPATFGPARNQCGRNATEFDRSRFQLRPNVARIRPYPQHSHDPLPGRLFTTAVCSP